MCDDYGSEVFFHQYSIALGAIYKSVVCIVFTFSIASIHIWPLCTYTSYVYSAYSSVSARVMVKKRLKSKYLSNKMCYQVILT